MATSGDHELAVDMLAGPGQVDIGHYLANSRQGTSGQAFTISPSSVNARRG